MKRILKTMASMLLIASFAAMAVSCSKDDDNNGNPLIGKWKLVDGDLTYTVSGKTTSMRNSFSNTFFNADHYIEFKKDGTYEEGYRSSSSDIVSGTYTVSGNNKLIFYNEDYEEISLHFNISGKKLRIEYDDEYVLYVLRGVKGTSFKADDVEFYIMLEKIN